ncbi:MAG: hypothetical protein ABIT04_03275 [Novosphingobium sp.]
MMRRIASLAAAMLAVVPGIANAAAPNCLTAGEFASLMQFALPSVINGATQRCTQALPASAFLRRQGPALAARYGEGRAASWPEAKAAFLKMSANDKGQGADLIRAMPDPPMQQMLLGIVEGMVSSQLPLAQCGTADRIVGLLAPLPVQNTAELIGMLVELGTAKDSAAAGKVGSLNICRA